VKVVVEYVDMNKVCQTDTIAVQVKHTTITIKAPSWRKPPNGLAFSRRERAAQDDLKKPTISRAQRSAATPGWAATKAATSHLMCSPALVLANDKEHCDQGYRDTDAHKNGPPRFLRTIPMPKATHECYTTRNEERQ
jgi:hypothetical protein